MKAPNPHSLRRRLTCQAEPQQVKRAHASGRRHNEWGFSNPMLDATVALMDAK